MADLVPLATRELLAKEGARAARARSLSRRSMGRLFPKYVSVVPSVFSARGDLFAYRLLEPRAKVLEHLKSTAVLTLESATEAIAGFRFGRVRNDYAYFASVEELLEIESQHLGERRPGTRFPFDWTPEGWEMLFAVVPRQMPPNQSVGSSRTVTRDFLVRDLIGFHGLRPDLVAVIEAKLGRE